LEEAYCTKLLVSLARRRTHGQTGPEEEGERKPYARADFLDDKTVRDLAYDHAAKLLEAA
jgi:hypothetical protein